MKKIFKNRVVLIAIGLIIVLALVLLIIFNRTKEDIVTRVSKVLGPKYYNINCINNECNYMVAYKGDKKGKTQISVVNPDGKIISKYDVDYSEDDLRMEPVNASTKYVIVALKDKKNYTHGYIVLNSKGKEVLKEEEYTLYPITDKYLYGKKDDYFTIYDYKGNTLYKDVKDIKFYNDNKIITFETNSLVIIDENSNRILDDYEIVEEVKTDNKTDYLVIKDKNGSYFYYDVNNYKIVGDSFNSYIVLSDNKLLISKRINNSTKKYVLDINGKEEKELGVKGNITDKVIEGYTIIDDSIINNDQKGILVVFGNSFGTYELETDTFNKVFDFKGNDKKVEVYNLYDDLKEARLEIGCSKTYCEEKTIIVYNPYDNTVSLKLTGDKDVKKYREYKNGYKVVMYSDGTYALFDDKGETIVSSSNNIVVVDQDELIDDNGGKSNVLLYSSKEKKLLNDDNTLALLDDLSIYNLYRFYNEEYMYIFNNKGKLFKKIPIEESGISIGDKYILHTEKGKVNLYSLLDNSKISFNLDNNESVNNSDGTPIVPNKGLIIVSNNKDNIIKVYNSKKKLVKKIKKSEVISIDYNEESNSSFLIIKKNKKYSLYIIK
ncbi:MAG: hypothetical protein IKZ96_04270 [Bacilli bacterium]|nr:hypothetical protein [Bacilli bacterium]